jgi:acyl-CoA synthetase (AMP-forming)/AMP-acid ligase II
MQEHPDFGRRDLSSVRDGDVRDALRIWPKGPEQRASPLGMTETCGPHSFDDISRDLPEALRGCAGRPVPGMEHAIVDPESGERVPEGATGEIWVRGRSLMQGLYKREREAVFDADGFYHTGDLGRFAEGRLFFAGRRGDMIKTGGANVSPREVEIALLEAPELSEAYVVGVPDAALGQIVAAAVVTKPGATLAPEEVTRRLKERLSAYKVPKLVAVHGEGQLPYRANGKVDRNALTGLLASRWKEPSA